jgi:hypothetical protein
MNRDEHYLTTLGEEGAEVAHRASKALRFGTSEVQPGHSDTNAERLREEVYQLLGTYRCCEARGLVPPLDLSLASVHLAHVRKQARIERFLEISRREGTLDE